MDPIDGALAAGLAQFKELFLERAREAGFSVVVYGFPQPDRAARLQDFFVACEAAPRAHRQIPTAMLMRLAAGEQGVVASANRDIDDLLQHLARRTAG